MFTVLIMNKKTMDSFYDHLPLFNGFLQDDETQKLFAVCEWNESGQTVEEALPDLHELTDEKGSWRALIVRYEDGPALASHPQDPENPYDFLENSQQGPSSSWPDNPLIRLTRMLEQPLEYFDRRRADLENPVQFEKYRGVLPESMTLITLRHIDGLQNVPESLRTIGASDFSGRNGYPSFCRFAVVDQADQGIVRRRRDDFLFWNLVLMLAVNRIDSSFMQAYRLYALSCEIDPERLEEVWKDKMIELKQAESRIAHFLNHQSVYLEKYEGEYPDYAVKADGFSIPASSSKAIVSPSEFEVIPADPALQAVSWKKQSASQIGQLVEFWNSVPNEIQKKTPAFSRRGGFKKEDVDVLSPLQREKLTSELMQLRDRISREFRALPGQVITESKELTEQANILEKVLAARPPRKRLTWWTAGLAAACLIAVVPAWMAYFNVYQGDFWVLLALSVFMAALPLWFVLSAISRTKKQIQEAVLQWNRLISAHYDRLNAYLQQYVQYESDLLSYRKGKSYLELSRDVSQDIRDHQRLLEKTVSELNLYQKLLERWGRAFGLSAYGLQTDQDRIFDADLEHLQVPEKLFSFESELKNTCLVNETGRKAAAPFSFIRRLNVEPIAQRREP